MVLSQVIVDFQPNKPAHDDIEVWNSGDERMYVVAQPSEIVSPGQPGEQRVASNDPAISGLLVSPQRMVLEPGQRRIVRISAVVPRSRSERVYRVMIKPVSGPVNAETSALKVLVGYDVLVIQRPLTLSGDISATRAGRRIVIRNDSNSAQEMFDGKQCDSSGRTCVALASTRLYPGSSWEQALTYDTPVEYQFSVGRGVTVRRF